MNIARTIGSVVLGLIAIPFGLQTILKALRFVAALAKNADDYSVGYALGQFTFSLLMFIFIIWGIFRLSRTAPPKPN